MALELISGWNLEKTGEDGQMRLKVLENELNEQFLYDSRRQKFQQYLVSRPVHKVLDGNKTFISVGYLHNCIL